MNTIEMLEQSFNLPLFNSIVSGGFATINPDNSLNINAVEACPLDEISLEVNCAYTLLGFW